MALQIKNLKTVTFRTDCFASISEKSHHLRKTPISHSVTFNKGTSSEYTMNYEAYRQGYTKHKDIQSILPDQSQKSFEIGYNTKQSGATNPIVVDKLLLYSDFNIGDVQYSSLKFQFPALGVRVRNLNATDKSFMLFDKLYPYETGVYADGKIYEENTGYSTFQNRLIQNLWSDYCDIPEGSGWGSNWQPINCSQFGINTGWSFNAQDASGDILNENGGYPGSSIGMGQIMYNSSAVLNYFRVAQENRPELYNYIIENFQYGGMTIISTTYDWNDGTPNGGNIHHGILGYINQYGSFVYNNPYLEYFIVPFISETERDCAKSSLYWWSVSQRNAFNAAYGE